MNYTFILSLFVITTTLTTACCFLFVNWCLSDLKKFTGVSADINKCFKASLAINLFIYSVVVAIMSLN